jgi:hypothetical protein
VKKEKGNAHKQLQKINRKMLKQRKGINKANKERVTNKNKNYRKVKE